MLPSVDIPLQLSSFDNACRLSYHGRAVLGGLARMRYHGPLPIQGIQQRHPSVVVLSCCVLLTALTFCLVHSCIPLPAAPVEPMFQESAGTHMGNQQDGILFWCWLGLDPVPTPGQPDAHMCQHVHQAALPPLVLILVLTAARLVGSPRPLRASERPTAPPLRPPIGRF